MILGDFNNTLGEIDRCWRTVHMYDKSYKALFDLMNKHCVTDVWRNRNATTKMFSRKIIVENTLVQSRIDFMLISRELGKFVRNIYYVETTLSDHSMVVLYFRNEDVERGPGLWILNNELLHDEIYEENIIWLIEKDCMLYNTCFLEWWDNLKYKVKKFSQYYSRNRIKEHNKEYFALQNKIKRLSERIANGEKIDIERYEALKSELSEFEIEKCRGAILRSKAQWANESDKCTKYFLNL